jgi:hypothetical protein
LVLAPNPCLPAGRDAIRDFWPLSEISERRDGKVIKISASSVVGLVILMCILAAMVSIAIMQVVRTVEDIGPKIYIVGGAVALVGIAIPVMLIILVLHLKKTS